MPPSVKHLPLWDNKVQDISKQQQSDSPRVHKQPRKQAISRNRGTGRNLPPFIANASGRGVKYPDGLLRVPTSFDTWIFETSQEQTWPPAADDPLYDAIFPPNLCDSTIDDDHPQEPLSRLHSPDTALVETGQGLTCPSTVDDHPQDTLSCPTITDPIPHLVPNVQTDPRGLSSASISVTSRSARTVQLCLTSFSLTRTSLVALFEYLAGFVALAIMRI